MKKFIKLILLKVLKINLSYTDLNDFYIWQNKFLFGEPFPQFVKKTVFKEYNLENSIWVETGTYLGDTTMFLSSISKEVISLEPSQKYFKIAERNLINIDNCKLINSSSEISFEDIISNLSDNENVCFYLDGHFSGGDTYKGKEDTPVKFELKVINKYLKKFKNVSILIDDFRLFNTKKNNETYPDKSFLINWAVENNLKWTVTRDMFVLTNSNI